MKGTWRAAALAGATAMIYIAMNWSFCVNLTSAALVYILAAAFLTEASRPRRSY